MPYRIDSVLCEWNAYGEFLSLNICVAFMLLIDEANSVRRIYILGALTSLMTSLILSLNRGSWIGFGLALISATLVYIRKVKITWIVIGLVIVAIPSSGVIISRFGMLQEQRTWGAGTKNTLQGRINAWKILLPIALKRPITGYGIGNIREITDKHLNNVIIPHNDYLRLIIEVGIPGALLYIVFICSELIRSLKNVSKTENWYINYPFLMAIIYFIILSAVQNIIQNLVVFPMFLGLAGLTHKVNKIGITES
jgi:O-antigen ligase